MLPGRTSEGQSPTLPGSGTSDPGTTVGIRVLLSGGTRGNTVCISAWADCGFAAGADLRRAYQSYDDPKESDGADRPAGGRFAHLPDVLAEGRRVMVNIERPGSPFLFKSTYAMMFAVIVAFTGTAYALAVIWLMLISAVAVGMPAFALALGANSHRDMPSFRRRVLRFAVPVGMVTGASAYLGPQANRVHESSSDVAEARTTLIVLIVSLWTLLVLARPLTGWKLVLVASMAGIVAFVLAVLAVLAVPALVLVVFLLMISPLRLLIAGAIGAAGAVFVELTCRAIQLVARMQAPSHEDLAPLAGNRRSSAVVTS